MSKTPQITEAGGMEGMFAQNSRACRRLLRHSSERWPPMPPRCHGMYPCRCRIHFTLSCHCTHCHCTHAIPWVVHSPKGVDGPDGTSAPKPPLPQVLQLPDHVRIVVPTAIATVTAHSPCHCHCRVETRCRTGIPARIRQASEANIRGGRLRSMTDCPNV